MRSWSRALAREPTERRPESRGGSRGRERRRRREKGGPKGPKHSTSRAGPTSLRKPVTCDAAWCDFTASGPVSHLTVLSASSQGSDTLLRRAVAFAAESRGRRIQRRQARGGGPRLRLHSQRVLRADRSPRGGRARGGARPREAARVGRRQAWRAFADLTVRLPELAHEAQELVHRGVRHRVVEADADAAEGRVAAQLQHAAGPRLRRELRLQLRRLHRRGDAAVPLPHQARVRAEGEADGGPRPVRPRHRVHVEAARAVHLLVDAPRALLGPRLQGGQGGSAAGAPLLLKAPHHLEAHVDGEDRRRVHERGHRRGVSGGAPIEDARRVRTGPPEQVTTHHDEAHAGGPEVLARGAVDRRVPRESDPPGQ
mmetsp:Transcript_92940/g.262962  ORF Transcript_92940/g.262962 Transcript_92940/m.262962 type:complete len:370 (-) Transcript_92940:98-1207(-)